MLAVLDYIRLLLVFGISPDAVDVCSNVPTADGGDTIVWRVTFNNHPNLPCQIVFNYPNRTMAWGSATHPPQEAHRRDGNDQTQRNGKSTSAAAPSSPPIYDNADHANPADQSALGVSATATDVRFDEVSQVTGRLKHANSTRPRPAGRRKPSRTSITNLRTSPEANFDTPC